MLGFYLSLCGLGVSERNAEIAFRIAYLLVAPVFLIAFFPLGFVVWLEVALIGIGLWNVGREVREYSGDKRTSEEQKRDSLDFYSFVEAFTWWVPYF